MKSSKFRPLRIIAGSLIILGAVACNNTPENNSDTDSVGMGKVPQEQNQEKADRRADSIFVAKANEINLEEIKLGELAKTKSNTENVVQLADMLINDHTDLKQKLSTLADQKSMTLLPLSDDAQQTYNELKNLTTDDFDNAYINKMIKGHKMAIGIFSKDSTSLNDSDIRQYAIETLPILRKHINNAIAAQKEMNSKK